MARILIAWELGAALGHIARCLQLGEGLHQRGHSVMLALRDARLPAGYVAGSGMVFLPAPISRQPPSPSRGAPVNYAGVLTHDGFSDPEDLAGRLAAWQGLFSLGRPDVLVADHAPTALLAARLSRIPHLTVGNGFAVPPAVRPWPSIRPWESVLDAALDRAEAELDRVTGEAQRGLGHTGGVRMRDVFGAHDVLDTFAELDHYGPRTDGCYVGPIVSVPGAMRVAWQSRLGAKVLAYLRPGVPGFEAVLYALTRLDAEVLLVAPGMIPDMARRFATKRMRISLVPIALPPLFEHADLAVSYGNGAFSTSALLAGVPLLMCPRYVEQALFARRIEVMGMGKCLGGRVTPDGVAVVLRDLLDDPTYLRAAHAFRDRYCGYSAAQAVQSTLQCIERVLEKPLVGGQ